MSLVRGEWRVQNMTTVLIREPVAGFGEGWPMAIAGLLALLLHTAFLPLIMGIKIPERVQPQIIETWLLPAVTMAPEALESPKPAQVTPVPARATAIVQAPPSPSESVVHPQKPLLPKVAPKKTPAVSAKTPVQIRTKVPIPRAVSPSTISVPSTPKPPPGRLSATQILASRNQTLESLSQLDRPVSLYTHSRRRVISATTREYRFAAYVEAWRHKVERIGRLNFPAEARQTRLAGELVLQVAVRADGQLEGVRLLHSSGYPALDEAAQRIVRLAAPFSPFPPDLRAELDVLEITRSWKFQSDG